jgi:uncharacterized membrane protein YbhN (UPF0104 family)
MQRASTERRIIMTTERRLEPLSNQERGRMAADLTERIDATLLPPPPVIPPASVQPPEDPPGDIGSKLLKPQTIISFVLALAIMVFFFRRLDISLSEVWADLSSARLQYFLAALVLYYIGMLIRGMRWGWMLEAAEVDREPEASIPGKVQLTEILMLSWFVNCLVPARLGDAYRSYVLKRESKVPFSASLGTILAERIVDLFVLVIILIGAGIMTFRGHSTPGQAEQAYVASGILVVIGFVGLLGLWFARHHVERFVPEKWRVQFGRLHDSLFACLRKPGRYIGTSVIIWILDGARMMLVAKSLGVSLTAATSIFVALMASLLTTLPITPAGLGVVETAIIVVLKWVDVAPSLATSVAVLDRLITYWSLILIGLILYIKRFRTEVR